MPPVDSNQDHFLAMVRTMTGDKFLSPTFRQLTRKHRPDGDSVRQRKGGATRGAVVGDESSLNGEIKRL
jgi:hypothetical protein